MEEGAAGTGHQGGDNGEEGAADVRGERLFYGWDARVQKVQVVARCQVRETGGGLREAETEGPESTLQTVEAAVLDSYIVKLTALSAAVEAAAATIRITEVIVEN
jgi:hypothetical protein